MKKVRARNEKYDIKIRGVCPRCAAKLSVYVAGHLKRCKGCDYVVGAVIKGAAA